MASAMASTPTATVGQRRTRESLLTAAAAATGSATASKPLPRSRPPLVSASASSSAAESAADASPAKRARTATTGSGSRDGASEWLPNAFEKTVTIAYYLPRLTELYCSASAAIGRVDDHLRALQPLVRDYQWMSAEAGVPLWPSALPKPLHCIDPFDAVWSGLAAFKLTATPVLRAQHPSDDNAAVGQRVAALWHSLTEAERVPFRDRTLALMTATASAEPDAADAAAAAADPSTANCGGEKQKRNQQSDAHIATATTAATNGSGADGDGTGSLGRAPSQVIAYNAPPRIGASHSQPLSAAHKPQRLPKRTATAAAAAAGRRTANGSGDSAGPDGSQATANAESPVLFTAPPPRPPSSP